MTRRHLTFLCEGDRLAATLDEGANATGLLLVTGGNEIRSGAFSGQAALAASLAGQGYPVFRFDRRGIGDSEGTNRSFRDEGADIAAALTAFRDAAPNVERVVGFGNCDAASALMLAGGGGCDALVLSNPWTIKDAEEDGESDATPPARSARAISPNSRTRAKSLACCPAGSITASFCAVSHGPPGRKRHPARSPGKCAAVSPVSKGQSASSSQKPTGPRRSSSRIGTPPIPASHAVRAPGTLMSSRMPAPG